MYSGSVRSFPVPNSFASIFSLSHLCMAWNHRQQASLTLVLRATFGLLVVYFAYALHASCKRQVITVKGTSDTLVLDLDPGTQGGGGHMSEGFVRRSVNQPKAHNVMDDLMAFTGLNETEIMVRLRRLRQHHFAIEHRFIAPQSPRELAMYYRSSVGYLWANSAHSDVISMMNLTPADGPVLDYSGGAGNNVLAMAKKGIECIYFGIGMIEFEFAKFRVQRHGLGHLVHFVKPYKDSSDGQGLHFDPVLALELGKSVPKLLGSAIAVDVFEHIPNYHVIARHIVSLLRPGGLLLENSAFGARAKPTDIHLRASMSLKVALKGMKFEGRRGIFRLWRKQ